MKDFIFIIPTASSASSIPLPLGALFLAESLLENGFSIEIIDDTFDNALVKIDRAIGKGTIAFGISSLSGTQLQNAIKIGKALKQAYPKIPIILGGIHATTLPDQTLKAEFVDYIVYGEGEKSLPLLLNAIKNKQDISKIKGIGFKANGECVITESMGYTFLDGAFKLPYHLLDMEKYARSLLSGPKKNFYIMTSRGCPFYCKFCSNSSVTWPNTKMRYHSIDHIIGDILTLVENYQCDGITFGDENFFIKENRVIEICNVIIKNKLNERIKFRSAGRADVLNKFSHDTWGLLKKAGFIGIGIGLESGSQRILDFIGKGISLEQIYRIDEILTRYNFYKTYNFMTCIPGERTDDLKETLKLIVYLAKTSKYSPYPFGTLNKYIPLPGTQLYDTVIENYGFTAPTHIEGWGQFDFEAFIENRKTVRPWLSDQFLNYVLKVNLLIEDLNCLFTGKDAEDVKIAAKIKEIEVFINSD